MYRARDCYGIWQDRPGLPVSHSEATSYKASDGGFLNSAFPFPILLSKLLHRARSHPSAAAPYASRRRRWGRRRRRLWSGRRRRRQRRRGRRPVGVGLPHESACRRAGPRATGSARRSAKKTSTNGRFFMMPTISSSNESWPLMGLIVLVRIR